MGKICVVVDNHRLEPLLDNSDGASGSLRLTTIRSGQKRALIKIIKRSGRRTVTLYSIEAEGFQEDKPDMEVRGRIEARSLILDFLLRDKVFHRATVKLSDPRRTAWWVFIPAILAAAAILLLLLPRPAKTTSEAVDETPPPVSAAKAPPPQTPESSGAGAQPDIKQVLLSLTVYFRPDDATLTGGTRILLDGLLASLGEEADWRIEITGHCALAGTEKGRIELSLMRARAVLSYLAAGGFAPEREPEITGVGSLEPVTRDPLLQHLNRRVEITAKAEGSG